MSECIHGRLKRQCNECDLQKENQELKARIGRLELRIKGVIEVIQENDVTKNLEKEIIQALQEVVDEQGEKSLAHIQANAVEKFIYKAADKFPSGMSAGDLFGLFQQLRAEGK